MTTLPDSLLLAELHGVEYLQINAPVVLAVFGEARHYYCLAADWPTSPVAQEAGRLDEIAQLEARLAQLKSQAPALEAPKGKRGRKLAPPTATPPPIPPPAVPSPDGGETAPADIAAIATTACPHCEYIAATPGGLKVHIARRHKGVEDPPPAAKDAPPPLLPIASPGPPPPLALYAAAAPRFACARCGSDAFTASIVDPTICIRCDAAKKKLEGAPAFVCRDCRRDTVVPSQRTPAICVQCARKQAHAAD